MVKPQEAFLSPCLGGVINYCEDNSDFHNVKIVYILFKDYRIGHITEHISPLCPLTYYT